MSDKQKLHKEVKLGIFRFFQKNLNKSKAIILTATVARNLLETITEYLTKIGKTKEANLLSDPDTYLQYEASARLFTMDDDMVFKSPFLTTACLGSILDKDTLTELQKEVTKSIITYEPYTSPTGITYDSNGKYPVTFMKRSARIVTSIVVTHKQVEQIKLSIFDTTEFSILEHIYHNEESLNTFNPRKKKKFLEQMNILYHLRNKEWTENESFLLCWNNPFILDVTTVGLIGGMSKILTGTSGLAHNAKNAFIEMYNSAP